MNRLERSFHPTTHPERRIDRSDRRRKKETRRSFNPRESHKKWMRKDWDSLNPQQKKEVRMEVNEKIKQLMGEMVEYHREMGIKITKEGRIDTKPYNTPEYHSRVMREEQEVKMREESFSRKSQEFGAHGWEDKMFSDVFEKLLPILFAKFAPEKFIVVRSAKFDDYHHGIDNILIDRESGETLCTIDEHTILGGEITTITDEKKMGRQEQKKYRKILRMNLDNEVDLTYSFKKSENGDFVPHHGDSHPPLCMVVADRKHLLELISDMGTSLNEKTEKEGMFFRYIAASMYTFLGRIIEEGKGHMPPVKGQEGGVQIQKIKELQSALYGIITQATAENEKRERRTHH